jgi:hypothetical protein
MRLENGEKKRGRNDGKKREMRLTSERGKGNGPTVVVNL